MSLQQMFSRSVLVMLLLWSVPLWAGSNNFVSIADIHFDPFDVCANTAPCPLIQQLEAAPATVWAQILAAGDSANPVNKHDTNFVLLQSALSAIQTNTSKNPPQFILVLGDLLAHHFNEKYQKYSADKSQAGYQQFVKKTIAFLTQQFDHTFPTTDVFMTIGNNDSYLGDNISEINGAFFADTEKQWSQLIRSEKSRQQMQATFASAGYYAVDLTGQSGLRLIVLNSSIFSPHAIVSGKGATDELDWFDKQLQLAKEQNIKVLIAEHIPAGIDVFASVNQQPFKIIEMWQPELTARYVKAVQAYGTNIIGILTAHTHSDSFQIITTPHGNKIPVSSTPSISPVNGNNPGFKIYNFNSHYLLNCTTFYTPLAILDWQQEYDFDKTYRAKALVTGIEQIRAFDSLAQTYQLYYDTTSNTDPIHHLFNPYYWCQLSVVTATEYQACMAFTNS
jgi:sphingomyelin phosphodiesterase acid-like 3